MEYETLLQHLEKLLKETYSLWDPGWVGFNWRSYTYDHVQRVRGLALNLCQQEGGKTTITELASLLHDISKPYDGEYIVDEAGTRVTDKDGYWRNRIRRPTRHNAITRLYDQLDLEGQPHNESGAAIAYHILRGAELDESTCRSVAETIQHHLRPPDYAPLESRCLYDADTIDANIGLPAFVRNIYINLHFHDLRKSSGTVSTATLLQENPSDYVRPYVIENLPRWVSGKRRDCMPRLLTDTAHEIALARLERLDAIFQHMSHELEAFASDGDHQYLKIVLHYMHHRDDPSIAQETATLAKTWPTKYARGRELIRWLQREMRGAE